ncbi:MAG: TadE/TadG family type IV pilus assembly protein [Ilumatobacteraceae bacterium]|jgi:Flp pilus assembly protein TadG
MPRRTDGVDVRAVGAARRADRGETSIETVLAIPVVFGVLLLGIHASLWYHGAHVATAVAAHGAAAGARHGGGRAAAIEVAVRAAAGLSARVAGTPSAVVEGDDMVVTVRVTVPRLTPLLPAEVTRGAREPLERFVPEPDR